MSCSTTWIVALLLASCSYAQTDEDPAKQQRAALMLFDQFETVVSAEGDVLRSSGTYKGLPEVTINRVKR
jgi:hypothetical protein